MESTYDHIIHQLKVLSGVKKNGRVRMSQHGKMTIESETYLTPFVRRLRGDSREQGLRQISSTLSEAFHHTRLMLNSKYLVQHSEADAEKDECTRLVKRLRIMARELDAAISGLEALRFTYSDDAETVNELQVMEENIKLQLDEIGEKCLELSETVTMMKKTRDKKNVVL
jgi:hypothetical protein